MTNSLRTNQKARWKADEKRHGLSGTFATAIDRAISGGTDPFAFALNVRPDPPDFRDYIYRPTLIEIPAFKAPLHTPGRSRKDPLAVRNQLSEGSCTGQALAAVIDIQNVKRRRQGAAVPWRVSARMLYSSAQAFDEFADDDLPGSSIRGAIKGFWNRGACSEAAMPYLPGLRNDEMTVDVAKDARAVGLGAYFRLEHKLNDYHAALEEAGAILVSTMIHDGWWPENVLAAGGVIALADKPELEGAHAFAIVGHTPEGFLILNSWGPDWGGYDLHKGLRDYWRTRRADLDDGGAAETLAQANAAPGPLPGVALWTYEDWKRHVLDAWVLRLAAPTWLPSGVIGGYALPTETANDRQTKSETVRESDVAGHIMHVRNGVLVDRGLFATSLKSLGITSSHLAEDVSSKYDHLLFYAHGGLNTRDAALARAKAMIPVFKRNRIYPVFFIWRTSFNDTLGDILSSLASTIMERSGSALTEIRDVIAERMIAPAGSALWRQMKANAATTFGPQSAALEGLRGLMAGAAAHKGGAGRKPLKVHLVGHSAGAILLGHLIDALEETERAQIASTTLFAPACTIALLRQKYLAHANLVRQLELINLPAALELKADPSLPVYGKSILWLVSRAFEEGTAERAVGIAGIEEHWRGGRQPTPRIILSDPGAGVESRAALHGGFDNDPVTMNHLMRRITGRMPPPELAFRLVEISEANGF